MLKFWQEIHKWSTLCICSEAYSRIKNKPPKPSTCEDSSLKSKMKIPEEKSHQCTICHCVFSQKCNLKTHISSMHEGKKPHQCTLCDYVSSRKFVTMQL